MVEPTIEVSADNVTNRNGVPAPTTDSDSATVNAGINNTNVDTQQNSAALQFLAKLHRDNQLTTQSNTDNDATHTSTHNDTNSNDYTTKSRSPIRIGTIHRFSSRSRSRSNYDRYESRHSSSSRERYSTKRSRDRDIDYEYSHSRSRSRHNDSNSTSNEKLFDRSELKRLAELAKRAKERGITVKELLAEEQTTTNNITTDSTLQPDVLQQINETRCIRKLFLGNMPMTLKLTEITVHEFITSALNALGITTPHPILNITLNNASTFAFIEFRSVIDCRLCYSKLQGISLGGRVITVGHSNDYNADIDAKYTSFIVPLTPDQQAQVDAEQKQKAEQTATTINTDAHTDTTTKSNIESRIILLENMIDECELIDDSEYADLCADVRDECSKYGHVIDCIIPRKNEQGCGNIYIKYESIDDASKAITGLHHRTFSGKQIVVTIYSEQLFEQKIYNNSVT